MTLHNLRLTGISSADSGAVLASGGAYLSVRYCDFSANSGGMGAAVTLRDPGTTAEFHFSTFWDNSAQGERGRGLRDWGRARAALYAAPSVCVSIASDSFLVVVSPPPTHTHTCETPTLSALPASAPPRAPAR